MPECVHPEIVAKSINAIKNRKFKITLFGDMDNYNKTLDYCRLYMEAYGAVEAKKFYIVVRPLVNKKILNFIKELWTVPSISFSETTVENGKL